MANNTSTITTNATEPKSASADGVSASQHSLSEQMKADAHVRGNSRNARAGVGLRIHRSKVGPIGGT